MNRQRERSTPVLEVGGPATVYDQLQTAAYNALGLDEPVITYDAWMLACEAAWIHVAGQR